MARTALNGDGDMSLAIRAAWLHYAGGMTQSDVADRLGVPRAKAHRLISRANTEGAVKIFIDGEIAECAALESALCARYGLTTCEVVPTLGDIEHPMRSLGIAGARFLAREIDNPASALIGLGQGRTLAAAVAELPRMDAAGTRFVSLLGGVTRRFAATPYDVMHRVAEKTGAEAFVLPVPFFANSAADRDVLLAQHGVADVLDLARRADLCVVGLGSAQRDAQIVNTRMIDVAESEDVRARGAAAEMLGHFFDTAGKPIETALSGRTISVELDALASTRVVGIAGGEQKHAAVRAILASGLLDGLITDENTAQALADDKTAS